MDGLKKRLVQQSSVCFSSIGDLTIGNRYPITKLCNQDTQYGRTVLCTLIDNNDGDKLINVYLPKSIKLNNDEILEFNSRVVKNLALVYKGRKGRAFDITFE
ncbi:uncharacterized protein LOC100572349 [Acyrthosiphon pisum]|uniref:Uncharacterized protein n=1 Tax=Acyrthosiphon pisum TaxID=7029 RepID=A0A8R2ACD8_ACYPI|nr:uncharacterized protein LOC100572349 [Acyrthosiphon pisum]|eukprot:XP_003247271.1 PREDICTED: uncharacterized protein LOC100572349 isoform X2 [Acyrthosiphon pisum]